MPRGPKGNSPLGRRLSAGSPQSRGTPNSSLRASISHSVGGIPNMLKNSDFILASGALSNNVGTKCDFKGKETESGPTGIEEYRGPGRPYRVSTSNRPSAWQPLSPVV
jgi:hypothetical protein